MPKLTPEEKRMLRIQKKLDKKREKIERQRQVKRDQLQRELVYGQLTLQKHEKEWKEMLIGMSLPDLQKKMEYAFNNFQRIVDVKDFTISLLLDELAYAEDQYLRNFSHHTEHIDNLHRLFSEYVHLLRDDFESSLKKIRSNLDEFSEYIRQTHQTNCAYLTTMIYAANLDRLDQEKSMKIEYYGRMSMEQTEKEANLERLKVHLENRYQTLFNKMNKFINDFYKKIRKRKEQYDLMKSIDDDYKNIIDEQTDKLEKSYDFINKLKEKFSNIKRIGDRRLTNLMTERDYLLDTFKKLKLDLNHQLNNDDNKLILLIENCDNTEDYLEKLKEKGGKLLHFVSTCRQLEIHRQIAQTPDGIVDEMELFWQKFGQIKYDNLQISKEIALLKQENYKLTKKGTDAKAMIKTKTKSINIVDCNFVLKQYKKWQK